MDPAAMKPFGLALLDFWKGDKSARFTLIRDDGFAEELPISHFFRVPGEFTGLEQTALDRSRGRVLDVGAGAGHHSQVLQRRGIRVCAIDISAGAVQVMREEGVADVREADVLRFDGGRFDTILMLGHGIGMAEDIDGLRRFLKHLGVLLRLGGQVLVDSLDPRGNNRTAASRLPRSQPQGWSLLWRGAPAAAIRKPNRTFVPQEWGTMGVDASRASAAECCRESEEAPQSRNPKPKERSSQRVQGLVPAEGVGVSPSSSFHPPRVGDKGG